MKSLATPWAPWARKTCTVLLWSIFLAGMFVLVTLGFGFLGDADAVQAFFGKSGRLALDGKDLDLSGVTDVGQIRLLLLSMLPGVGLSCVAASLVLTRLRNLLDEVLSGRPFAPQSTQDLRLIGTVLLVSSIATPLSLSLIEVTAGMVVPGHNTNLALFPELTLLLCGFVVRTLAVIFAHGVKLQTEADLTV